MEVSLFRAAERIMQADSDHLSWHKIEVAGRPASYGVGGSSGPAVVFLHGWALGSRAYKRAIKRLTTRGCRVYAPALPSFGGTADLPGEDMNIDGYANWVLEFMKAVGIEEPVMLIGHSFGGGVAIQLANKRPELVRYLVLLNAVGGVAQRPPWDWAAGFGRELWPLPQAVEMMQAMRADLIPNLVRNPIGLVRVGVLAQDLDLRDELASLGQRGVPVLALTSEGDSVIPREAFETLCDAIGANGKVVHGRHSWLLADPDSFGEVLSSIVDVQVADHEQTNTTARIEEVARLLEGADGAVERSMMSLLHEAPPLWLMSEGPQTLASDLALCRPALGDHEVRALAVPIEGTTSMRLCIVTADRFGLLADSTAVLAESGLSIISGSAATWTERNLALHSFIVESGGDMTDESWTLLGERLRQMVAQGSVPPARFRPMPPVRVSSQGDGSRLIIKVTARDRVGLLSTICRWFQFQDVNIESLQVRTENKLAKDTFIVVGNVDANALSRFLSH